MLAASWRPGLPGAADRIAARLEAGTAPDPAEWGLDLLGVAETPAHVRVAVKHAYPLRAEWGHGLTYEWTLRRPLAHPDPAVREAARKAVLADCLRFPAERGGQGLVRVLALVADETTIPVLEEIVATAQDPYAQTYALGAIARLRPAEAVGRILAHAARVGNWTGHPELLAEYATAADADRVLAALGPTALEQTSYSLEHLIRLCLSKFGEAGRQAVEGWLPGLSRTTRAVAVWGLHRIDLRAALGAFAAAGLLPLPADEVFEATRKFREEQEGRGSFNPVDPLSLLSAFYCAGILVSFDAESDRVPSPHDELVMQFGRHSRGGFAPECAIQVQGEDEPDEEEEYDEDVEYLEYEEVESGAGGTVGPAEFDPEGPLRVQFVHAGKVYEFDPKNYGDWYDVGAVAAAVNRAVADAGRPERFIEIDTGGQAAEFVFADPARFLPVAGHFAVPVQPNATRGE
jgi:hypothetical protein